ncbi:MAG: fatty acid desaturase family protein [Cytophagaceae bacterium]
MLSRVRFIDKQKSGFFAAVRERVDDYFKANNLSKNANGLMYFKTIFYLGGFVSFYALIISNQFTPGWMLFFAILLGVFSACIGFNICHDAVHGSYSSNATVNKVFGYLFNLIGANTFVWSVTHNVVHHTYTNIHGNDEDLEIAPGLIRLDPNDKFRKFQKFQHIYAFFLYGFASLSWVFRKDYVKFFKKEIGGIENTKYTKRDLIELFGFKALYYVMFIVIPLIVLDISFWQFLVGFLALHFAEGFVLGIVFQLAHVVENTEFPETNTDGNIEEAWAVHQMKTTANFARKSFIATWICGGLNMQVEHHLFPKICHIHYPAISEIVKKTAEEFNVPYNEFPTFLKAVSSHYTVLKKYGTPSFS